MLAQVKFALITIIICALTVTNVYADQLGSQQNPYVLYRGWQGPGYYYFTPQNYETGYVSDICQLNSISIKITQNPLEHPFDPNQIGKCMSEVPEFGSVAVSIMAISFIGIILVSRKKIIKQ